MSKPSKLYRIGMGMILGSGIVLALILLAMLMIELTHL